VVKGNPFVQNYLGFIVLGTLLCFLMIAGAMYSPPFMTAANWLVLLRQFCIAGMIALGAAASSKLRGPDISMGQMMALGSVLMVSIVAGDGITLTGVAIAILACGCLGLISGAIISFLRAPAIIVTFIMSSMARGIAYVAINGAPISLNKENGNVLNVLGQMTPLFMVLFLALCGGIAFVALWLGRRTKAPGGAASKSMVMLGYGFTAAIAVFAGLAMSSRLGAVQPTMGTGYELLILFVLAAVQSSRLLDHGVFALGYALIAAFLWTLISNIFALLGIDSHLQMVAQSGLVLILLCIACAARGGITQALMNHGQSLFDGEM